jgi:hypothetical protein
MKKLFTVSMVMMGVSGLFLAAGCGSDGKGGGSGAGARDAYKQGTTQCSDTIKKDAQALKDDGTDFTALQKDLDAFCDKYKGVVCDDKDENGKPMTVNIDDLCADLKKQLQGGN